MPTIEHIPTARKRPVSDKGLKAIQGNPLMADQYRVVPEAEEPEEVTKLKQGKGTKPTPKPKAPNDDKTADSETEQSGTDTTA